MVIMSGERRGDFFLPSTGALTVTRGAARRSVREAMGSSEKQRATGRKDIWPIYLEFLDCLKSYTDGLRSHTKGAS